MTAHQENLGFHPLTAWEAKALWVGGHMKASGYVYLLLTSLKKHGWKHRVQSVAEFCKKWGLSERTFYKAKAKLVSDGLIGETILGEVQIVTKPVKITPPEPAPPVENLVNVQERAVALPKRAVALPKRAVALSKRAVALPKRAEPTLKTTVNTGFEESPRSYTDLYSDLDTDLDTEKTLNTPPASSYLSQKNEQNEEKKSFSNTLGGSKTPKEELTGRGIKDSGRISASLPSINGAKSERSALGKPAKRVAVPRAVLEQMILIYNDLRPRSWSIVQVLNKSRERKLTAFAKEHGDRTLEIWENALRFAGQDEWCVTHNLSFENFLTNNKPVQYAERWVNRATEGAATPEALKKAKLIAALVEEKKKMDAEGFVYAT